LLISRQYFGKPPGKIRPGIVLFAKGLPNSVNYPVKEASIMYDDRARCDLQLCVIHKFIPKFLCCIFVLVKKNRARDSLYIPDNFI
jgi:hypothetical protein